MMNITYHTRGFILLSQFRPQKCTEKLREIIVINTCKISEKHFCIAKTLLNFLLINNFGWHVQTILLIEQ